MATLSNRIKSLRQEQNLTQEEFGRLFGVVKSTVSLYENGRSIPNDQIKTEICRYFGVSMDYLLGLTDDRTTPPDARASEQDGSSTFSKRLHDLRIEKRLTQQELADQLNLGRSTVAGYEVKGKEPDNARLCQLADFFGVSVDYLLGHTDNPNVAPSPPENSVQSDPAYQEALQCLEGLSNEAMASALRCLQAIKKLDEAKGAIDGTAILEKNA